MATLSQKFLVISCLEVLSNIVVFDVSAGVRTCHRAGPLVHGLESGGRSGGSVWSEDIVVVI